VKGRSTIKDIARLAGVSPMTVSRVLNRRPGVKEETRRRVLDIVQRLGYRPSLVARSLVTKRSETLGVIITTIRNPLYLEMAQAMEDKARAMGYNLLLASTHYDRELEARQIEELRSRGVDGLIITSAHVEDPKVAELAEEGFPVVLVNRRVLRPDLRGKVDFVGVDNRKGAMEAVEHLLRMGHRRVGIISGRRESSVTRERLEGAKEAFRRHGLQLKEEWVVEGYFQRASAYEAAQRLLQLEERPTAIFAMGDYMAFGVYDAALQLGLRVPEDLALVGFNDIDFSSMRAVGLTTVHHSIARMGELAVEVLLERIGGRPPGRVVILEPRLVIRSSCGFAQRMGARGVEGRAP